jgi:hypothetical protein
MINYFFSLSLYLTENKRCLDHKTRYFSLTAYVTETQNISTLSSPLQDRFVVTGKN